MLEEIGSYDAKTKLSEILRRVENGEGFTITNRGKPVADLIPSQAESRSKAKNAIPVKAFFSACVISPCFIIAIGAILPFIVLFAPVNMSGRYKYNPFWKLEVKVMDFFFNRCKKLL